MPYCPTCKKEYPSGTTICAECNISLVDNRPSDLVSFVSLQNQEVSDRFIEYLKEHDIKAISEYGIRDDVYRIYVDKEDKKTAMKCFISFQAAEKRNKTGVGDDSTKSVDAAIKKADEERKAKKKEEEAKKAEAERLAAEKKKDEEKIAAAMKAEEERRAAEQAEADRIAAEKKAEEERLEAERRAEEERIAREKAEAERLEAERRAEEERLEAERKAEEERIAREKAEAERLEAERRAEEERLEAERKAEEERIAREKAEAERLEAERKAEEERIAREKAEAERLEAERKAEEERIAREKAEAERLEAERRAEEERIAAAKKAEEERIAREKAEAERIAAEKKAEEERIAREKAEAERIAREKAEAERIAAEKKAEEERIAREKAEAERIAAEKKAEEERIAAEKKAAKEREALEKKRAEEAAHETEFTANAATRTKRPYYPKSENGESPASDTEFESIFAAKKDNKKRTTLFAEMEKNEEAAAATTQEEGDSGFDFTPKRPLTAYQFEKKRQEDLVSYAMEHENAETATSSVINEDDGKVNISFSDYEQTYEVPSYEDADPTPVYSDPDKKIDWGAGADDTATDWQNQSSAGTEPIFVETERVNSDDIDDDKIIDENDIRSFNRAAAEAESEAYVSPVNSAEDYESESEAGDVAGSEDAFSDFLNNFKRASLSKSMKKSNDATERGKGTYVSARPTQVAVPEQVKPATKKPVVSESAESSKTQKVAAARTSVDDVIQVTAQGVETVVEDIIPDAKYRTQDETDYQSVPSRPTDIQDTKIKVSFDNDIIEEVISDSTTEDVRPNIDQSSSFANPDKPVDAAFSSKKPTPRKFETPEELDDGTYRGFVPDYSPTSPETESTEPQEISEYDEFKKKVHARKEENQAINAQIKAEATRQANLVKDFGKKGKIVFEDTDDLDNYAGFVPDYTPNTSNEEEFDFYKPHQVSSYSKYKKGTKGGAADAVGGGRTNGFMRLTSDDEVESLFISHVPSTAKKVLKPQEIKNANFLINMSGKRLSKLFNSWMMLNVTSQTVRAFEKEGVEDAENYELKISGIKKLLTDNFGEINEVFLDSLVQRYYSKFLDE